MDRSKFVRKPFGPRLRSRMDRTGDTSSRVRDNWSGRVDPQSRSTNASLRGAEFQRFARLVERDLNPRGPLERIVTRHAARAAWALQGEHDRSSGLATDWNESSAARTLKISITTLDLLQGRRSAADSELDQDASAPCGDGQDDVALTSNEWPVLIASEVEIDSDADLAVEDDGPPIWQGRLVFDFDISTTSPVVRGTWVTVSHIVSLVVDGASWADILRSHPELTEVDIRACVAYAVAEDDSGL